MKIKCFFFDIFENIKKYFKKLVIRFIEKLSFERDFVETTLTQRKKKVQNQK